MSKAEEKANEYAEKVMLCVNHRLDVRDAYWDGYEQAEKDMQIIPAEEAYTKGFSDGLKERLTWEDVQRIVQIADKILPLGGGKLEHFAFNSKYQTEQSYYEDVLKRYNDGKQ